MALPQKDMPRAKRREAAVPDSQFGMKAREIDPTENVKALMAASLEALADLRISDREYFGARWVHLKEMADLRAEHSKLLRESDLATAEKTRQVDVLAAAGSATSLATAVSALQATTDRSTETLRNQVAATAAAMAKQTADSAAAVQAQTENLFRRTEALITAAMERISALERANAAGAGRAAVVDPQMTALLDKMDRVVTHQAEGGAKSVGVTHTFSWILAGIAALGTLVGLGGTMVAVVLYLSKT